MTDYLAFATTFTLAQRGVKVASTGKPAQMTVKVEQRLSRDGEKRWVIARDGSVFNHVEGSWEIEPSPSNRDEDFLADTRFDSLEAAFEIAQREHDLVERLGYTAYIDLILERLAEHDSKQQEVRP